MSSKSHRKPRMSHHTPKRTSIHYSFLGILSLCLLAFFGLLGFFSCPDPVPRFEEALCDDTPLPRQTVEVCQGRTCEQALAAWDILAQNHKYFDKIGITSMSWTQMASSRILSIVSGFAVASKRWWVSGPCKVCSLFQTSWICVISLSWSNTCYFTHMCHCPTHTLWSSRLQPIQATSWPQYSQLWRGDPARDARWCEARYQLERLHTYLWTFESVLIGIIYIMFIRLIISNYINIWTMLVWLYHISMILTEVIPFFSPQLQPGVAWQVTIRGRITLVADHVTEFYGCSGRALRSPLANVPANCRATFLCFVTLFWLSLS